MSCKKQIIVEQSLYFQITITKLEVLEAEALEEVVDEVVEELTELKFSST
jgi:hypothetical protein